MLAALLAAPAAIPLLVGRQVRLSEHWAVLVVAAALSGLVAVRLLLSGDRVGRNLRAARRRHRDLVDLLGVPGEGADRHMRVLEHTTPTAYCVPGVRRRVVLTQGTLDRLGPDELSAVLAHERAHLSARHDLVVEFFTVVHEAVPGFLRCDAALREVLLLIEVLADRAAVRRAGAGQHGAGDRRDGGRPEARGRHGDGRQHPGRHRTHRVARRRAHRGAAGPASSPRGCMPSRPFSSWLPSRSTSPRSPG